MKSSLHVSNFLKITNLKKLTFNILLMFAVIFSLTVNQKVKGQTYGTPLFTEDFGTVPSGQTVNTFRDSITGRGTIGNDFWLWPYTCPSSGKGWMILSPPTVETSYALTLPASEVGVTQWSFVQSTKTTGTPFTGSYLNNPNNTWCLSGSTWTGPNPSSCSGTYMRWYQVCGTWKLGYYQRSRLRQLVACSSWHNMMDDGGYALSANPNYVHGNDGAWHTGPDHTGNTNGMMLVVNAALQQGMFYERQITGLCYGALFDFRSYYQNILMPSSCGGSGLPINIRYEVWDKDPGQDESNSSVAVGGTACNGATLLAQTNTGNVAASSAITWYQTDLIFQTPQNQDNVFIILRNNSSGGCGNDLAIDDISFSPYIPFTVGYTTTTTNYCTTGKIRLTGSITSGSIPTTIPYVFQWQVADKGATNWTNLGSTITDFANAYVDLNVGDIGNKIYRIISAASVQNFNNSNCYVASSSFDGNSVVIPTGSITSTASDVCGDANHTAKPITFTVNYQGNKFPWTYYYSVNGGATQSQSVASGTTSSQTINITDSTNVNLIKISTSDCDVNINSSLNFKYSIGSPGAPILISGPNPACIGTQASFTVPAVQGAVSYNWVVSGGWSVISGQGTRNTVLQIGATPITVNITTVNACGTNTFTSATFQTTNLPPSAPASITTPNGLCIPSTTTGTTDVLFQCTAVSGAQNYIWDWDSPVVIGTQQSGTGQYLQSIILTIPNNLTTFNVRVKTQNGCGYSTVLQVPFTPTPITTSASAGNIVCNGGTTILTATATGGTGTLQYSINGGTYQSGNTFTVNAAGSPYTVTVKDATGCTATTNVVSITQPTLLAASITAQTNILCYGNNTGSATATATGGTSPYTYSWNTSPAQTSATASNLTAGTYSVTVTDKNGCKAYANATITQPTAALTSSITSQTNVLCFGNNTGVATVTAAGGTNPYTYLWNTTPTQTTATASSLTAGTYNVTITDKNNCTSTASVTITQPSGDLTITISAQTNVACYGNNTGSATVSASAGTAPYTYSWNTSPVQTTATATNLAAGTYSVTVTDKNGCTKTASATITQPSGALSASITAQSNVTWFGGNNGSATVTAIRGTSPYTYAWSTSPVQTSATASNLTAGTFTVTVTDKNGCTTNASVTISQPSAALTAAISSQTNILCYGNNTGAATVTAAGGTTPYSYAWSTSPIQNSSTATNLVAGTYTVTVTDFYNNTITAVATITQPSAALSASISSQTNVLCFGNSTGAATVSVTGGTTPYAYSWNTSPIQTSATAHNLAVGTYTVTITDKNDCVTTANATITQPAAALASTISSQTNVLCYGNSTGAATVTVSNGTAPYSYLWNTTPVQTTAIASNLAAGAYSVTVTDNNGCTKLNNVAIAQPTAGLSVVISAQTNVLCYGSNTGIATVSATGGTSPYTYSWNTSPVQISATASNLSAGTYTVTITDNNGCTKSTSVTITQPTAPLAKCKNITIQLDANGNASITAANIDNVSGDACGIKSMTVSPNTFTCANVGANSVTLTVTDNKNNVTTCTSTVTVQDNVAPVAICKNITVQLDATGNATITATQVDNGSNDACGIKSLTVSPNSFTCANVGANTVTLTVKDNNNNTATCSPIITIEDKIAPVITKCSTNKTVAANSVCKASVPDFSADVVANDNCTAAGNLVITQSPTVGTLVGPGTTTVTITVKDAFGNSTTCTNTLTVTSYIDAKNDAGTAVNGYVGGTSFTNVLSNDLLNCSSVNSSDVNLTFISATNTGITLSGSNVVVAAGTPAGNYTLTYQICEKLNPTNCDQAVVSVPVTVAPILAVADNGSANGMTGGTAVSNVLTNDLLNGVAIVPSEVNLSFISSSDPKITLIGDAVVVAPGTPAGTYTLNYKICEILNPTNCSSTTVTVTVSAAVIVANDDAGSSVNGYVGGTSFSNVLTNDLLNGAAVVPSDVNLTFISSTNAGVTLSGNNVVVTAGTPAGNYTLTYQICEKLNPTNCDQAVVSVPVTAAPILAVADNGSVNGFTGGTALANVLFNDLLNGVAVVPSEVNLSFISSSDPKITLIGDAVVVAPGTPAGTYTLNYKICEILNPTNCSSTTVTVTVSAAPIVANDDAGSSVNGYVGGTSFSNVLVNDLLNGAAVVPADVNLTFISSTNTGITLSGNNVVVATGTPAGNYTLTYQICEKLNPTNCDQAVVSVPVSAAPIQAVADAGSANGMTGGTAVANVLTNDLLNGVAVIPSEVNLSFISSSDPKITLNGDAVVVAPGTPAGTYTLNYKICEILNPTNCSSTTVTVTVSAAVIVANDDAGSSVNGYVGGTSFSNVLTNDLLNGAAVVPADVNLTFISSTNTGITLSGSNVVVAAGTPAGNYTLTYQICEKLNPTNCDQAVVSVPVSAAPILAVADNGSANGMTGGTAVSNVLTNDLLNGVAVVPSEVNLSFISSSDPKITLNGDAVVVAPGTPAGTYTLNYKICEILNPTNCSSTTVTVTVSAAPIVANDDAGSSVNGYVGGTSFSNVLTNDLLNGAAVVPADVNLTFISATNTGITLSGANVVVAAGTPAGNYTLTYQICEKLNPTNCDQAVVSVPVTTAPILAVADNGSANGMTGGTAVSNVLTNDLLNGVAVVPSEVTITALNDPADGVTLNTSSGEVTVDPGTLAGTYYITYQICENLNTTNCSQTLVTVVVTAVPPICSKGTIESCYATVSSAEAAAINATTVTPGNCTGKITKTASTVGSCNAEITVTSSDECNHSCSVTYNTRIDSTKPVITRPSDINVNTDSGKCSALVNLVNPIVTDNCEVKKLTNDAPSTGNYPLGSTTVTWTATDECGNTSSSIQIVTVKDNTPPVAISKDITVQLDATGNVSITADQVDNGSNDACGIKSITVNPNKFNCSNVGKNTVTLTVTDNNDNVSTTTATVTVWLDKLTASITSQNNILCNGDNTGSATVTAQGGKIPYSYLWNTSPAQANNTAIDLSAGLYSVTVTDFCGNSILTDVTITQPDALNASITSQSNVTNYGGDNGSATVTAIGGVQPYSYSWNTSPVQTTATANNLSAGNYIVTITDNNGCSTTVNVTISQPLYPLTADITSQTNVLCFGNNTGTATVTAAGGTNPYTYAWSTSPVQTSDIATNLTAGTYTVTVTDFYNNTITAVATITQPDAALAAYISSQTNVLCFGENTGSATVLVNGGTSPYKFLWSDSNNQTSATAINLTSVNYSVTVTDNNNCSQTADVSIIQPTAALSASITAQTNVLCFGNNSGSATASAVGGSAPYTYEWSDDNSQITATADNLTAGNYTVTVTDNNGCTSTASVAISQPSEDLSLTISTQTNVACFGDNTGAATASTSGGTAPYTYSWNTVPVQTTASATNLAAGTYAITVTDNNGCSKTTSATITQPSGALSASITSQNDVTWFGGNNGSATATAIRGTAPYTFAWSTSPVQTSATASNLITGIYTVTVTDNNGCATTASVTINQPSAPLTATISSQTNVSCFGNNSGSATVTAAGGTAPYAYTWSTSPVQNSDIASNLAAGTYTVTVTDFYNNTITSVATISQPDAALAASVSSQTNVLCFGNNTGLATVSVTGGTTPYAYSWNTLPAQTSATAFNLLASTYTVTITDKNNCVTTANTTIMQPSAALATSITSQTNVSCFGNNTGAATVTASNGTAPYTYLWNTTPAQTSATASNLSSGNYTVTVTDNNACVKTDNVTITQPSASLSATLFSKTNVLCYGNTTGAATVATIGGTTPYTYSWNTTPVQTSATASNLSAGKYTVTIIDKNSCTANASVTIFQPALPLSASITNQHNVTNMGGNNGSATVSASGGSQLYSYSWNTSPVQTTATATNLTAGNYIVTVTDNNGCTITVNVTITQPLAPLSATITSQNNVICYGNNSGSATATAAGGTSPYTYLWYTDPPQTTATAVNLSAGTYTVTVTDFYNNTITTAAVITQPATQFIVNIASQTNVQCEGINGSASTSITGGVSPFNYIWNNNADKSAINGLSAGTYAVTVSDANNCTASTSVAITTLPTPPAITLNPNTQTVCDGISVNFNITATGAGLTYQWLENNSPISEEGIYQGTQSTQLTILNTPLDLNGNIYSCVVTNSCGFAATTTNAVLNVSQTPEILSTTDGSRDGSGTVNLKATATFGTINWYDIPVNGSSLATGNNFTTPVISQTTSYYVNATSNGCTSPRMPVTAVVNKYNCADIIVVTNTNDGGKGSLRQAILEANSCQNTDTIIFNIPKTDPGYDTTTHKFTICVSSSDLPAITKANLFINGPSEANYLGVTPAKLGTGGSVGVDSIALTQEDAPFVQVVNSADAVTGLEINAKNVSIWGLSISGFGLKTDDLSLNGNIVIDDNASHADIEKCVFGLPYQNSCSMRSGSHHIIAESADSAVVKNNLFYNSERAAVVEKICQGWIVYTNEFANSSTDSHMWGAILLNNSDHNDIENNLIYGSAGIGVDMFTGSSYNTISDNTIHDNGLQGEYTSGIRAYGDPNRISKNIIFDNYGAGVSVTSSALEIIITKNSIYGNGSISGISGATNQVGIDLLNPTDNSKTGTSPYYSLNHSGNINGGNDMINFPILDSAVIDNNNLILTGWAQPGAKVELFIADMFKGAIFPQGKTYLTSFVEGSSADLDNTVSTYGPGLINGVYQGSDSTNRFKIIIPIPTGVTAGTKLTATSYLNYETSEFCGALTVIKKSNLVSPMVECLLKNQDKSLSAYFGYNNPSSEVLFIPVGNDNMFTTAPQFRDQPTTFQPGIRNNVFKVTFDSLSSITWMLNGQAVTANASTQLCPVDLSVAKLVNDTIPKKGDTITFTIKTKNNSTWVPTNSITIRDTLLKDLTFISSTTTVGMYDFTTGIWSIDQLNPQQEAYLMINATIHASTENTATIISQNQYDPNLKNNKSTVSVTMDTTSGGNDGGLESHGNLASKVALRNLLKQMNNDNGKYNHPELLQKFTQVGVRDGSVQTAKMTKGSSEISMFLPDKGPFNTSAYVTTPSDLLFMTNAKEVLSVDYFDNTSKRMAAIFAVVTDSQTVYDHTKVICDRLAGATLDDIRYTDVNGHTFILSKLVRPGGLIDYSVSFIAYTNGSTCYIDNQWNQSARHITGTNDVLNFQVWSVSEQSTQQLVQSVLTSLSSAKGNLSFYDDKPVYPEVYVRNGFYQNGKLFLNLHNTYDAKSFYVRGSYAEVEDGSRTSFKDMVVAEDAFNGKLVLNTGHIFDYGFTMDNDAVGGTDVLYYADGAWGVDKTSAGADFTQFNIVPYSDTANVAGKYMLERDVELKGTVWTKATLFRELLSSGRSADMSGYNQLEFFANSTFPIEVIVTKQGISDWSKQYKTIVNVGPVSKSVGTKKYFVKFSDLANDNGEHTFTANDVVSVVFNVLGDGKTSQDFQTNISSLAFSNGSPLGLESIDKKTAVIFDNYPNPYTDYTKLSFELPLPSLVKLEVYDIIGNKIGTIADGYYPTGKTTITYNTINFKQGIYFYTLTVNNKAYVRKSVKIK